MRPLATGRAAVAFDYDDSAPWPQAADGGGATLVLHDDIVLYSGQIAAEKYAERSTTMFALSAKTGFLKSNGEARRELGQNAISVNKTKVDEAYTLTASDLISDRFVLLQRGKKNYFVLVFE